MTVVALALAATLAVSTLGFLGYLRSTVRDHSRERARLIDQIMHLTGRTWTPPPATPDHAEEAVEPKPPTLIQTDFHA